MATKKRKASVVSTQGLELEINELRSQYARSVEAIKASDKRIAQLEAKLSERSEPADEGEDARATIMRALSVAKDGKPGSLTAAQLVEQCNLTKSAVHTHVKTLERKGKVWRREQNDPISGRPCTVVYHSSLVRLVG